MNSLYLAPDTVASCEARPAVLKKVCFVVNGCERDPMGIRARSFAERLQNYDIDIIYRAGNKIVSAARILWALYKTRPYTIYVFDMAFSGVVGAILYALTTECRLVIDTGDVIGLLADSMGSRGWIARKLTHALEAVSISLADGLVVRGHVHCEHLRRRARNIWVIPDGVDTEQFGIGSSNELRQQLNLQNYVVLGVLGSITWNRKWGMCYGWELVQALAKLRDLPVKGVVIGDGNGLERLKAMAREFDVADRMVFLGRIPYEKLPLHLGLFDICLSTQTNDLVGQVRTTGKLPLYLACGKQVIATEVGEAKRVLPSSMLLRYDGIKDRAYPARLAKRLREIIGSGEWQTAGSQSRAIAKERFDYSVLINVVRRALAENDAREVHGRGRWRVAASSRAGE